MIKEVAEAIDRQDYQTADQLLQTLRSNESDNIWIEFYTARLNEVAGKFDVAAQEYRELLQLTNNPKLIAQIRQGIERLEAIEKIEVQQQQQQRQVALEQAKAAPHNKAQGLLILEPVPNEQKQAVAQKFAKIIGLDPYTARLQLPSRSWRLYRVGAMGELQIYVNDLQAAGVPCFCTPLKAIARSTVYLVKYFESVGRKMTIVYESTPGTEESISFTPSEVTAKVEGLVPIFGECVDLDVRHNTTRKTSVLDYVQILDLHLKKWNLIIRLCDHHYDFQQGHSFSDKQQAREVQTTNRDNWNHLARYLKEAMPEIPVWSDFKPFAETTADFYDFLSAIDPHLNLLRIEESYWDTAFHLYSSLILIEKSPPPQPL